MNSIARTMADAAWERVPASPAMDMRENGKSYEIYFAVPTGIDESHVRVTAKGSLLTLALMTSDAAAGSVVVQRFRIPCGVDRAEDVETVLSNNVLRVRIRPAPGNG